MMEKVMKYILGIVLAICGFLLANTYNRSVQTLACMSKELSDIKLEIIEIKAHMLDETRVRELIETELLKHNIR